MAKNNFTFQTAIKLNSSGFKKGVNDVKKSLNTLKNSFLSLAGALGAGLSFGKLISEAKKTATELSVAMAVLENASKVTNKAGIVFDNYATNLEFVRGLSKKYKQDMIELINTFGQFTAAANQVKDANGNIALSLEDQKYIYEQLTRAAAGYHMSADRTRDMMNAVIQMMSKGKVAAEELRRQLGNALPGAFGIMAAAMGVSNAELEDMMKNGQLLSAEALPRFAKMLEGITEHMSFDSLQSSTNELKNAWVELIDEMNVSSVLKEITDALTKLLNFVRKNLGEIYAWIKGTLFGGAVFAGLNMFYNTISKRNEKWAKQLQQIETLNKRIKSAQSARPGMGIATTEEKTSSKRSYYTNIRATGAEISDQQAQMIDNRREALVKYNKNLLEMDRLQKKLGQGGFLTKEDVKNIKNANKHLEKAGSNIGGLTKQTGFFAKAWGGIRGLVYGVWDAIKGIGISMIAFAIIGTVVGWITKIRTEAKLWREEQERINKILPNYEKSISAIATGTTTTANNLRKLTDSLRGMDKDTPEYASKIQEINKQLGLTGEAAFTVKSAYEDINREVDAWIDKQRTIATINKALSSQDEASARNMQLNNQLDEAFNDFYNKFKKGGRGYIDVYSGNIKNMDDLSRKERKWLETNVRPLIREMQENRKVIDQADKDINNARNKLAGKYGVDISGEGFNNTSGTTSSTVNTKTETPSSVMEDFIKSRNKLENQFKNGALTEEEFKNKLMELQDETYQTMAAFDEWDKVMSKLSKTAKDEAEQLKAIYPENKQKKQDAIDKSAAEKKAKQEAEATRKKIEEQLKALDEFVVPKAKKRDSTFDYAKTDLDVQKEIADLKTDQADTIRELIDSLKKGIVSGDFDLVKQDAVDRLIKLVEALREVRKEADNLQRKIKLSEAIDELNKRIDDLKSNSLDNISSLASAFDRVNNSLMSIAEVFDEDLKNSPMFKAYEKFSTVLNHSIQIMEAIGTVINTLKTIEDIAAKEKVRDDAMVVAANKAATESEIEKATASASAAAAGAASSVAGVPIIGPGLAVAAVATIVAALLAGMGKFANGGFVNGPRTGDRNVIRANGGEYVMTTAQQRRLLEIMDGKTKNSGVGEVEFKIRGCDLISVINNEYRRRKG